MVVKKLISDRAVAILAKIWDVFTIIISFIDVISDIVVAKQFYDSGHTGWFWAVFASLLLSNVAYTVWCIESYDFNQLLKRDGRWRWIFGSSMYSATFTEKVARAFWLFPFAQLCPTLVWIAHEIDDYYSSSGTNNSSDDVDVFQRTGSQQDGDAADQELEDILGAADFIKGMQGNLDKHLQSHGLFYIETIVESIPQSIVQLMAVTMIGEATEMQLFSMTLSLISIVSKAYIIAQSSDLKVFAFKFFLAAHDVFSLFYAFSSVLSADQEKAEPLVVWWWTDPAAAVVNNSEGSISSDAVTLVSPVCASWFYALQLKAVIGVVLFWTACISGATTTTMSASDFRLIAFCFCLGFFVMVVPMVFITEGLKLSWLIFALFLLEPNNSKRFPMALALRTFCSNATDESERRARVRYLYQEWLFFGEKRIGDTDHRGYYDDDYSSYYYDTLGAPIRWHIARRVFHRENDNEILKSNGRPDLAVHRVGNWRETFLQPSGLDHRNKYRWSSTTMTKYRKEQNIYRKTISGGSHLVDPIEEEFDSLFNDRNKEMRTKNIKDLEKSLGLVRNPGWDRRKYPSPVSEPTTSSSFTTQYYSGKKKTKKGGLLSSSSTRIEDETVATHGNFYLRDNERDQPTRRRSPKRQKLDALLKLEFPIEPAVQHNSAAMKGKQEAATGGASDAARGEYTLQPLDIFWDVQVDFVGGLKQMKGNNEKVGAKIVFLCAFLAAGLQMLFALFSLSFPFYNVLMYHDKQNAFQLFCFAAMVVSLVGAGVLLPHVLNFAYYSSALSMIMGDYYLDEKAFRPWINTYHRPTNQMILAATVPPRLLNHDLVDHVSTFLPENEEGSLNKRGVSLRDCLELKKQLLIGT